MAISKEMVQKAIQYRGEVLNEIALLEKFMDQYITNYFTNNDKHKSYEMLLLIVGDNRMSMENKRQVFHFLAEKYDKEWYLSYKSIRKFEIKKDVIPMNKDFVYAIEMRNVLAHRVLDTRGDDEEGSISFLTFKNELGEIEFSKEMYADLIGIIKNMNKHFYDRPKFKSKLDEK